MKVTMFWSGGSSYACFDVHSSDDAEVFDSLDGAKRAFRNRTQDAFYPCVDDSSPEDGGPEAWIFFGESHPVIGQEYPDRVLRFGPRGGVVCERA